MGLMTGVVIGILCFFLLWVWAVKPRTSQKAQVQPFFDYRYAHRGLHDEANGIPENSMAAFVRAVERGYGIELDVHLSKDGQAVVFHDATLQRICGKAGYVWDFTAAELTALTLRETTQNIPLLREVLAMVEGKVPIIVEIKAERNAARLCQAVSKLLDAYKGRYCIQSFDPRCIRWFRKNRPHIVRGQLAEFFRRHGTGMPWIGDKLLRALWFNFLGRPDFIAYNIEDLHKALSFRLCCFLYRQQKVLWVVRSMEQQISAKAQQAMMIFENFCPEENV